MPTKLDNGFFGASTPEQLLDLVMDETANSLSPFTEFSLGDMTVDDQIEEERPGAADDVRIAMRFGYRTSRGVRMGFVQVPLDGALLLGGALLMRPTSELAAERDAEAPGTGHRTALMEVGELIGKALDGALKSRHEPGAAVRFFGCQGVAAGEAAWVSGYEGQPFAVRRQNVSLSGLDPFEMLVAVPV